MVYFAALGISVVVMLALVGMFAILGTFLDD